MLVDISDEIFFEEIKKIKDISILRDIFQFYQNEYSNFFSDASNLEQKITSLFNLSTVFLGFFITIIIFLVEHNKFSFLKNMDSIYCFIKFFLFLILLIGITYLFIFTFKMLIIHKVKTKYKRITTAFPIISAYDDKIFKYSREKEFLSQMIYNCYKVVIENYSLLEEKASSLLGKHDAIIICIIITMVSLLFISII